MLDPFQEAVEILGSDLPQGVVRGKEARQKPDVGGERLDGVGGAALVLQVDRPRLNGRRQGGLGCEVGRNRRLHTCLLGLRIVMLTPSVYKNFVGKSSRMG